MLTLVKITLSRNKQPLQCKNGHGHDIFIGVEWMDYVGLWKQMAITYRY